MTAADKGRPIKCPSKRLLSRLAAYHAQVSVDARDMGIFDGLGQGLEPPLWLPLIGVLAPKLLPGVACSQTQEEHSSLRYWNLCQYLTVCAAQRLRKRKNSVDDRSGSGDQLQLP